MIRDAPAEALVDADRFRESVMTVGDPVVVRGATRHWPMMHPGIPQAVIDALTRHDAGEMAEVFVGNAAIGARYHWARECLLGEPLILPAVEGAALSVRAAAGDAAAPPPEHQP